MNTSSSYDVRIMMVEFDEMVFDTSLQITVMEKLFRHEKAVTLSKLKSELQYLRLQNDQI